MKKFVFLSSICLGIALATNVYGDGATLSVSESWGEPSSSEKFVYIELANTMGVAGAQFILKFDGSLLTADSVSTTNRSSHMDIGSNITTDSVKIVMYNMSGDSILQGTGTIFKVFFSVSAAAILGDSTLIELKDCILSDPYAQSISCDAKDGWFYFVLTSTSPELISPENDLFISNSSPTFVWSNVNGASQYWLQIDEDSNFSSPVVDDSTLTDSLHSLTIGLTDSTYYWRICAGNRFEWSGWSLIWSFKVDVELPSTVTLVSPLDNAYLNDSTVNFVWNSAVDAFSGIDHYILQCALDIGFATIVFDTTLTKTTYGQNLIQNPEFEQWTGNSPNFWNIDDSITVSEDNTTIHGGTSSANITLLTKNQLLANFYSDMIPVHSGIEYTFSTWIFDNDSAAKGRMVIWWKGASTYYGNYSTDTTEWQKITTTQVCPTGTDSVSLGLRFYDISEQWDGDAVFWIDDASCFAPSESLETVTKILPDTIYYWRVKAVDKAGNEGNWSSTWSFDVDTKSPIVPTLTLPSTNAYLPLYADVVAFEWNEIKSKDLSGFDSHNIKSAPIRYIIQVDTLNDFSDPMIIDTTELNYDTLSLVRNKYYWRVMA